MGAFKYIVVVMIEKGCRLKGTLVVAPGAVAGLFAVFMNIPVARDAFLAQAQHGVFAHLAGKTGQHKRLPEFFGMTFSAGEIVMLSSQPECDMRVGKRIRIHSVP